MRACSTGSPASRRSTNCTPFTTRPSLTSRQGMMRTLSMVALLPLQHADGVGHRHASVIERTADDGADDAMLLGGPEFAQIVERADAAPGDDRRGEVLGERDGRIDIDAAHRAVAVDVGVDDGRHAGVLE